MKANRITITSSGNNNNDEFYKKEEKLVVKYWRNCFICAKRKNLFKVFVYNF